MATITPPSHDADLLNTVVSDEEFERISQESQGANGPSAQFVTAVQAAGARWNL